MKDRQVDKKAADKNPSSKKKKKVNNNKGLRISIRSRDEVCWWRLHWVCFIGMKVASTARDSILLDWQVQIFRVG